jgi:hypothetical protein
MKDCSSDANRFENAREPGAYWFCLSSAKRVLRRIIRTMQQPGTRHSTNTGELDNAFDQQPVFPARGVVVKTKQKQLFG